MDISILTSTVNYVTSAPYFWVTMGMITGLSMFIGAIIFDGDLSIASKAMIGLGSYIFFVIQTQLVRIGNALQNNMIRHSEPFMFYASNATLIIISLFWIFGVLLGVFISSRVHGGKHG